MKRSEKSRLRVQGGGDQNETHANREHHVEAERVEHDPDRRADGQHEIADAREKSRGVRGVVAIRVSQAFPVRRGRHDSKPDCAADLSASPSQDLYDLGGEAAVCAAQHLRVNFPFWRPLSAHD